MERFVKMIYTVIFASYTVILILYTVIFLILRNAAVEIRDVVAKHYILSDGGIVILTAIN